MWRGLKKKTGYSPVGVDLIVLHYLLLQIRKKLSTVIGVLYTRAQIIVYQRPRLST
jgi:hypothetical protein